MREPMKKDMQNSESYSPKDRPAIISMAEKLNSCKNAAEIFVQRINDLCSIVDRPEIHMVGIGVPVSFESQGYVGGTQFNGDTFNDYFISKKYITDGTIAFLGETLCVNLKETEIISARYDVHTDGNYRVIVGIRVDSLDDLPEFMPEHTVTLSVPASRYARMEINEQKQKGRVGYDERMKADEYFIGDFRKDSEYIFDIAGIPMNTWDETGDILTKYEPIRKPANETDRFDTFSYQPVLLPPWKIACCVRYPGDNDDVSVLFDYFKVQDEVYRTGLARFYKMDYYGFPIDAEGGYASCFGSRVFSFEGLPDCVERITLPGGMYVHITQKEINGDNPSMPYNVAFNHIDEVYLALHPEYEFDFNRKVIARFRQANCASVFLPIRKK